MNTYSGLIGFFLTVAQAVLFSPKPYLCLNRFLINCIIFSCLLFCDIHVPSPKNGMRTSQYEKRDYWLKLLGTPLCKAIETNISKDMIIKQGLSFTNECAGQKSSEFLLSENIFSSISPSCVIAVWGLLEGVEFFQMLVLLKCTWLLNYKQLM